MVIDSVLNEEERNKETNFGDFINMEEDVAVCGDMTDADILSEVVKNDQSVFRRGI